MFITLKVTPTLPHSGSGRCLWAFVYFPVYMSVCVWLKRVSTALRPEKGDDPLLSRVTAPCDVPAIDTEHSTGLLRDAWTLEAVPGSSTGGLKSSAQLMFNPFDFCREVAFPEFLMSISSGTETMNGFHRRQLTLSHASPLTLEKHSRNKAELKCYKTSELTVSCS